MREIISIFIVFCIFQTVASILCYECVSLNEEWCTEHFVGKDMSSYRNKLINCTGQCMKLVAHVSKDREFYVRTCDVTNGMTNTCTTASLVLGIPLSTICVCNTDGCNGANITRNIFILILISIVISSLYNI